MLVRLMLEGSSLTLLLMEWLLIILPFVFGFCVCTVTCGGKNPKKQPPGKQQKPPTLQAQSNSPTPKESPKATPTSPKASTPKPPQLGGGPGSTIQVPFSKEKMLWDAMTDKDDGKKK
uniref:ZP domain-containing protein n=1 Tax=Meloidogyne hapla TaxID=6305 RepID=A0A1I8BWX0_MELHA